MSRYLPLIDVLVVGGDQVLADVFETQVLQNEFGPRHRLHHTFLLRPIGTLVHIVVAATRLLPLLGFAHRSRGYALEVVAVEKNNHTCSVLSITAKHTSDKRDHRKTLKFKVLQTISHV